ncbi:I78 family peptidase inhibitor [Salipiger mucosus]|uniref:Peptidase inhibitor I78 family protein n=1 Tax=Salipiger mucosus DSM 16094 TaxID=1123237 RepID=S9QIM6_9RHOB|nr:I78 family peptidase inhibitor [Salipiger mucosus]EPX79642.1 hypothetical protein Salmuc_05583 [Salipiger mucosus DSM 16094]
MLTSRIAILPTVLLLAACQPVESGETRSKDTDMKKDPAQTACQPERFEQYIGQPADTIEVPEGTPYRVTAPGTVITMEHLPQRVNFQTDEDGIVLRITCG